MDAPGPLPVLAAIHAIRGEFDASLLRVRERLDTALENAAPGEVLATVRGELVLLAGIARMVPWNGPAQVLETMLAVLDSLLESSAPPSEAACGALLSACLTLPDYLDLAAEQGAEQPLLLLPLLNELRLAAGAPLLTEADAVLIRLRALSPPPRAASPTAPAAHAQAWARKLLPTYEAALLSVVREQPDARASLGRIGKIAEQLAAVVIDDSLHRLWLHLAAVVEALLTLGLESSSEVRRQLAAGAQVLKALAAGGERVLTGRVDDLSLRLLYFVARAEPRGPRVTALRKSWSLESVLPSAATLEAQRQRLRGPSVRLLQQVVAELRSELEEAKDAIDLALRTGRGERMEETRARLQRLAATLSTLGLPTLARGVERQAQALPASDAALAEAPWMAIATALLRIEYSLEEALFGQVKGLPPPADLPDDRPPDDRPTAPPPSERDVQQGRRALVREALVELARIKERLEQWLKAGAEAPFPEVARPLRNAAAGLRLGGATAVAEVGMRLAALLTAPELPIRLKEPAFRDRWAEALALFELQLEALRDALPGVEPSLARLAVHLDDLETSLQQSAAPAIAAQEALPAARAPQEEDEEIRAIFLEEAEEVAAELRRELPFWLRQPEPGERLQNIRRVFHTLKGSGRMVAAADIAEFGRVLEHLLNRCRDGAIAISDPVVAVIRRAETLLPALISAFRERGAPPPELQPLLAEAEALAAGRRMADPDLLAVFQTDVVPRLAALRDWLAAGPGHRVPEPVVRAAHTLRGAAAALERPHLAAVAAELERGLASLRAAEAPPPKEMYALLVTLAAALDTWVERVGQEDVPEAEQAEWLERLAAAFAPVASPAGVDPELAHVFSMEACDLLDAMEARATALVQHPGREGVVEALAADAHTLAGAASMAKAPALAQVAKALQRRLVEVRPVDARLAAGLPPVLEGLRSLLDAYRDGSLEVDADALLQRVEALGSDPETVLVSESGSQSRLAPPAEQALGPSREAAPAPPSERLEAGGSEPRPSAPLAPEAVPVEGARPEPKPLAASQAPHEQREHPEVETVSAAADETDDLRAVFLLEARELLEGLDGATQRWERERIGTEAGETARRLLHTLKGSARMAGFAELGEVAQRLEAQVGLLQRGIPDVAAFARLQLAVDGLHRALARLEAGAEPDYAALLRDAEAVGVGAPPVSRDLVAPAAPRIEASENNDVLELRQIFAAEALELVESLEAALDRQQRAPGDVAPRRDLLRVLHTLKGGARMAEANALADAAHALESRIESWADLPVLDPAALSELSTAIDVLRQLSSALEQEPVPAVSTAAPEPSKSLFTPEKLERWDPRLFWRPDEEDSPGPLSRQETARVPVERLDAMLKQAGEVAVQRARLEERLGALASTRADMAQAIGRLRDQLRQLEAETDAQIRARGLSAGAPEQDRYAADFDPLEMDRYTRMQELSRALNESVGDLAGLEESLSALAADAEALLTQQRRSLTDIQQGLMGTLMVPFSRQVARLQRLVRSVAEEQGKRAELVVEGEGAEMDRNVLDRMTAPLEHLLRNAVVHGIEPPAAREAAGKPPVGQVRLRLKREGSQLWFELSDDGAGLNFEAIEQTALRKGLLAAPLPVDAPQREADLAAFIFEPGFSTAATVTQTAGRGIGTDVVAAEVKQLGGTLAVESRRGQGTTFRIRLPLTLALSQALLVEVAGQWYALPLAVVDGIVRLTPAELTAHLGAQAAPYRYAGVDYPVRTLAELLGEPIAPVFDQTRHAVLIRGSEGLGGSGRVAVLVDQVGGRLEIVAKPVGPTAGSVPGVSSATILPDGRVVLVLDVPALMLAQARRRRVQAPPTEMAAVSSPLVLVVDDSITIRRVTERLLGRHGYRVATAKDGLDAMAQLQELVPAAVLLDIEMPRADGFEVASFIRNQPALAKVPIVMITSRSGEKHRNRAAELGVDRYLVKPYQEEELLAALSALGAAP